MGHLHKLIVFDLDGTLIDSRADLAEAANALIVERGGRRLPEASIARMVGDGAAMLVQRALTAASLPIGDDSVARFLELYDERLLATTKPYPGIPAALQALARDNVLAVLTNKPMAPTRTLLDALGLAPFIASALGGDGPFPRKPNPAGLGRLIEEHRSTPARTVLVGDSRIDLATARAAGTPFCLARYGFGFEGLTADDLRDAGGIADDPSDIPAVVYRLLDNQPRSHLEF